MTDPGFQAFLNSKLPHPLWLIEGLISGGRTLVYGRPKVGKSFFGLQIAQALANQEPLIGYPAPTRKWRILYVSLDAPGADMQDQGRKLGITADFGFASWDHHEPDWYVPKYCLSTRENIALTKAVLLRYRPEAILWDCLTVMDAGGNFNDGTIAKLIYGKIFQDLWRGPQIMLAHANKGSSDGMDGRHPIERLKGATEFTADASSYIFIESEGGAGTFSIGGRGVAESVLGMTREPNGAWKRRTEPPRPPVIYP